MGTISNAIGAFVDMESFSVAGHSRLTGSLPASMSAWKKVEYFSVRGCKFDGVLSVLNYSAMKSCTPPRRRLYDVTPLPRFLLPVPSRGDGEVPEVQRRYGISTRHQRRLPQHHGLGVISGERMTLEYLPKSVKIPTTIH